MKRISLICFWQMNPMLMLFVKKKALQLQNKALHIQIKKYRKKI